MSERGQHPGVPGVSPGGAARGRVVQLSAAGGLAFGVAVGLLIVLPSGGDESSAAPAAEPVAVEPAVATAEADAAPAPAPAPPDAAPAPVVATVRFDIAPAAVAGEVRLRVDGDEVAGRTYEVALGDEPQTIEVVASAEGYRRFATEVEVAGDATVEVRLRKKRPASRGSGSRGSGSGGKGSGGRGSGGGKGPSGPGGLIDL